MRYFGSAPPLSSTRISANKAERPASDAVAHSNGSNERERGKSKINSDKNDVDHVIKIYY